MKRFILLLIALFSLNLNSMSDADLAALIQSNYTAIGVTSDTAYLLPLCNGINAAVGGASANHSALSQLDYASAGHTGFQPTLVSGTNIKTINSTTVLGSGNFSLEPTLSKGNLSESTSSVLTITGGTSSVIGSGTTIEVDQADAVSDGYLSAIDWGTFNDKQDTISGTTNRITVAADTVDIDTTLFPSPTAGDANKYLRATGADAATWQSLAGGGDVIGPASNTDNNIPQWNGTDSKTLKDGYSIATLAAALQDYLMPPGIIMAYAGSSIPAGWLNCDGSAVSRSTYSDLFTAIGTTWGVGDGSTTFNLPDLRSATIRGVGTPTVFTYNNAVSLADTIDDQFQAWQAGGESASVARYGNLATFTDTSGTDLYGRYQSSGQGAVDMIVAYNDGTHGDPRTGYETTGKARGAYWIIKY